MYDIARQSDFMYPIIQHLHVRKGGKCAIESKAAWKIVNLMIEGTNVMFPHKSKLPNQGWSTGYKPKKLMVALEYSMLHHGIPEGYCTPACNSP